MAPCVRTTLQVVDYEATDDMFLAKILVPEGTENIVVGQPMMVVCEDEESLPAFADFKLDDSAAVQPAAAKSPEPAPAAKKEEAAAAPAPAAPTPKPTPTPAPEAKPTPAAAPAAAAPASAAPVAASPVVFAEKWGQGIKKSPLSLSLLKKQQAYLDLYGITGTTPVGGERK